MLQKSRKSLETFFNDIVYKACSYQPLLEEVLLFAGLELEEIPSKKNAERYFGFKTNENAALPEVISVSSGSPAFESGLAVGDLIMGVDGQKADRFYDIHMSQIAGQKTSLLIARGNRIKTIEMMTSSKDIFRPGK